MKLKLTIIAAALSLGTASFVHAADKADRKVHNADEERIESEYKAAKEKCDSMQGNYFCAPAPAETVTTMLLQQLQPSNRVASIEQFRPWRTPRPVAPEADPETPHSRH